jgi:hypothetical protein
MAKKRQYSESEVELLCAWVADFGQGGVDQQELHKLLGRLQDYEFFENVRVYATRKRR